MFHDANGVIQWMLCTCLMDAVHGRTSMSTSFLAFANVRIAGHSGRMVQTGLTRGKSISLKECTSLLRIWFVV